MSRPTVVMGGDSSVVRTPVRIGRGGPAAPIVRQTVNAPPGAFAHHHLPIVHRSGIGRCRWVPHPGCERQTRSLDGFLEYLGCSAEESSACKEGYVARRTGWFSDRSAVCLAAGRPVVMQDTGFGAFLPVGEGLFAVRDVDEAAAAIDAIATDPSRRGRRAHEVAMQHLHTARVLPVLPDSVGAAGAAHGGI